MASRCRCRPARIALPHRPSDAVDERGIADGGGKRHDRAFPGARADEFAEVRDFTVEVVGVVGCLDRLVGTARAMHDGTFRTVGLLDVDGTPLANDPDGAAILGGISRPVDACPDVTNKLEVSPASPINAAALDVTPTSASCLVPTGCLHPDSDK